MIRPENETEGLLKSFTKNCETLFNQTPTWSRETFEFKLTQPKQTFSHTPFNNLGLDSNWMLGLTSLKVYNCIHNITEENIKFKLFKFPDSKSGGVSYEKVRDEIERDLDFTDFTATDIQDEIMDPIHNWRIWRTNFKKMKNNEIMKILACYTRSIFQDFES